MGAKFVDIKITGEPNNAVAKLLIAEVARDIGLEANLDVSRDGVMLYGPSAMLAEFHKIYEHRRWNPVGDLEDDF